MEKYYQTILEKLEEIQLTNRDILTSKGAAVYLGISLSHLHKLTMNNQIKHFKPGGKYLYFKKEDLDAYMLQNEVNTAQSIEQKAANYNWI